MSDRVYLIDEVVLKPGTGPRFLDAWHARYRPGAEARGMRLEHCWVSPPLWLDDRPNTLTLVWSVEGAAGFWGMTFQGRQDPRLEDWWWREVAPMIESRRRHIAAEASALAALNEV